MKEKSLTSLPGIPALLALLVAMPVAGLYAVKLGAAGQPLLAAALGVLVLALFVCLCGLYMVEPNQAVVLSLFGRYVGTAKEEGLRWNNPFFSKRKVSLRVRNFESGKLKVNELDGSPIEIGAVIVWQVVDSAEAVYNVDDYESFVHIQSESALRAMASSHPYDGHEDGSVVCLRSHPAEIAGELQAHIQERLDAAGVRVIEARLMPSILEFLDTQTVACTVAGLRAAKDAPALAALPEGIRRRPSPVLLVELDGETATVRQGQKKLIKILEKAGGTVTPSATAEEAEKLWTIRRRCSKSMFQMGDTKLNEDVVVPLEAQAELIAYTLELKEKTGLATPTFGHAADGNFHVHIMYNHGDARQRKQAKSGIQALMEKVIDLGGAITGEHGVGLAKSPFFSLQHGEAEIGAMQRIKHALDPNGILNPGKIFEPFEVWKHERAVVTLPWDQH